MPSYTPEQKRRALEVLDECGGRVTRAIRKLGYPTRQTTCQWINERDASHVRTVKVVGEDAAANLTLGSDFFQQQTGDYASLTFTDCSKCNTWFWERRA